MVLVGEVAEQLVVFLALLHTFAAWSENVNLCHQWWGLIPRERNRPLRGPIRIWFFWPKTS